MLLKFQELIFMVKVKLLEFQFLTASHVGPYFENTRICYIDACNGEAYKYTCQIKYLSFNVV